MASDEGGDRARRALCRAQTRYERAMSELDDAITGRVIGGGRIELDERAKTVSIYGYSKSACARHACARACVGSRRVVRLFCRSVSLSLSLSLFPSVRLLRLMPLALSLSARRFVCCA